MRPRLWGIRWEFRIGPRTSDATIDTALDRWRWRFKGDNAEMAQMFAVMAACAGRTAMRRLLLKVVDEPHPPVGWWDE